MKTAYVVANAKSEHQMKWGVAFAAGLRRHRWKVTIADDLAPGELVVMWGARRKDRIDRAKHQGAEVCILECGYVGDRLKWSSVSFEGGLNGRGVFRGPLNDSSRWERRFAHLMQPWRERPDGPVVIMGQVPGDTAVSNVDLPAFYAECDRAYRALGFDTVLRPHPKVRQTVPIESALLNARCVVTWNSNSGVDAVLAGVPTVTMDEGAIAWPVAGHVLALPPTPDRSAWAHALAWKQWTLEEMTSGECWATVGTA
ncbi:MAG: hypothetical protein GEU91_18505 [Rhizobiales bacterium]|nr:hypothetical protein [Hyphomicrobiales bacterium]